MNLIDIESTTTVDREALASKSRNCPFHGQRLRGWPVASFSGRDLRIYSPRLSERIRTYVNANGSPAADFGDPNMT